MMPLEQEEEERLFAVEVPPVDEEAAAERQAGIAGLLSRFSQHLHQKTQHHLGYPYNLDLDLSPLIMQFQSLCINNLGDPFVESNYGVHSRPFEVGVLNWFARLWDLHEDSYWGCITSCGTEGNLHGLLLGREMFPGGIMYASRDSHYSVFKAARMYRVSCVTVDTLVTGEMNCDDFRSKLMQNTGTPAIVNVNIGTTVKGAIDDLDRIIETLEDCGFNGRFYIHCDGALAGLMIPFIKQAPIKLTFRKPIGSVSVSGHKFLGCPVPCGVLITRREHVVLSSTDNDDIEYLSSMDTTIMGSRNGHAAIFLWYTLNKKGYRGIRKDVHKCLSNAQYLVYRLRDEAGVSAARLNPLSNTVVFERPRDETFVRTWQLACQGRIAHVVVMPNVTREKLDKFVDDLATHRAEWYHQQDDNNAEFINATDVPICIAKEIGRVNCLCRIHNNNMQSIG